MPPHILIVDDDPAIRATLSDLLADEGYTITTAANGAEALGLVTRDERPGVVLLDMRMPVMDGWAFARALAERGVSLPVIAMTAAQEAGRWSREIGARWVLAKPFDLDELLETVAEAIV
jgi:two-component system chemotaxis response regulator CheY